MGSEAKIVLGIAFLVTIIIGVFSLLDRLTVIFLTDNLLKGLSVFCTRSSLWVITLALIIAVLYKLNKRQNQCLFAVLQDKTIRITSGVLVGINGLINLSGFLPVILSTISSLKISKLSGFNLSGTIVTSIIINSVCLVIVLCQILFGIYLLKNYQRKNR